jgi:hypothetical protein
MGEIESEQHCFTILYRNIPKCVMDTILKKQAQLKLGGSKYIGYAEALNAIVKEHKENDCEG